MQLCAYHPHVCVDVRVGEAAGEKVNDVGGWVTDERGNMKKKSFRKLQSFLFFHTQPRVGWTMPKKIERGWGGIGSLSLILFFHA